MPDQDQPDCREPSYWGRESLIFLRRWMANPLAVGSLWPSSGALARKMAGYAVLREGEAILELGPGTGPITEGLLEAGIPEDRLILIERDRYMSAFLTRKFPDAMVLRGDAARLTEVVPKDWIGRISTTVSSLPMLSVSCETQRAIIEGSFDVMSPGGQFLQYTYHVNSPVDRRRLNLSGQRVGWAALNVPPATIWTFEPGSRSA